MKFFISFMFSLIVFNAAAGTMVSCHKGFMGYVIKLSIFEENSENPMAKVSTQSTVVDHTSVSFRGEVFVDKTNARSHIYVEDIDTKGDRFTLRLKKPFFGGSTSKMKGTMKLGDRLIKNMDCQVNI